MGFEGFPKEGVAWFQALALAQRREWFEAHRAGFQALWLEPMKALLDELVEPLSRVYRRKLGAPKVFRIHRDVRFSKDKSPYKTWMAGMLPFDGFKPMEGPAALYLHLGLEEVVAFGFYVLEPPALKKLRAGLLHEKKGAELARLVEGAKKAGLAPDAMEKTKRPPPGVDPGHPRAELLKHKALALSRSDVPKKVRYGPKLKAFLVEQAEAAAPVLAWGFKHL